MHVWGGYTTIIMIKYLLYFSKDCTFWLHVRGGALLEKNSSSYLYSNNKFNK